MVIGHAGRNWRDWGLGPFSLTWKVLVLVARVTAVTVRDKPVAGTGILRPEGPGGRSEM